MCATREVRLLGEQKEKMRVGWGGEKKKGKKHKKRGQKKGEREKRGLAVVKEIGEFKGCVGWGQMECGWGSQRGKR